MAKEDTHYSKITAYGRLPVIWPSAIQYFQLTDYLQYHILTRKRLFKVHAQNLLKNMLMILFLNVIKDLAAESQ